MRIIAGQFRGRTLAAPKGDGTRPTTDRVREALMSAVFSQRGGFEGAVVLDAFAGSGALGLEALSRGAASRGVLRARTEAAKGRCRETWRMLGPRVRRARSVRARRRHRARPRSTDRRSTSIFLDPPVCLSTVDDGAAYGGTLGGAQACAALRRHAVIVYEHAHAGNDVDAAMDAAELGFRGGSTARNTAILPWTCCAPAIAPRSITTKKEHRHETRIDPRYVRPHHRRATLM